MKKRIKSIKIKSKPTYDTIIKVEWSDLGPSQHVSNINYLRWVEKARVEYIIYLNNGYLRDEDQIGPVVAYQDCKYIKPVSFPDNILLSINKSILPNEKMLLSMEMYSQKHNQLVAISTQEIVSYNFKIKAKVALPLNWIYNH